MKDIVGQDIAIDQVVAFNPPSYKGLKRGKVVGFTPKMVKIEYIENSWTPTPRITNVSPSDIAVLDQQAVTMFLLGKK